MNITHTDTHTRAPLIFLVWLRPFPPWRIPNGLVETEQMFRAGEKEGLQRKSWEEVKPKKNEQEVMRRKGSEDQR